MFLLNFDKINKFLSEKIDVLILLIIFILTFIIYIKFLASSIFQGDPAELSIVAYILGIPHPNGYPIYTWIGHLFTLTPVGSVVYRVNLMSAFFGAVTTSLIYMIVLKIAKLNNNSLYKGNSIKSIKDFFKLDINIYRFIAVIAALSLAFSQTFWSQAEIAEVYTLNAFFVALMILILLKWNENQNIKLLYVFFLIYGLSIGAHASNLLFMPVFLIFIALTNYRVILSYKHSILFILFFTMGLLQFLYILIRASQNPVFGEIPLNIYEWWGLITAQKFSSYFMISFSEIPKRILSYLGYLIDNFLVMGLILGIIGLIGLCKNNVKILALFSLMFVSNVLFYLNYYVFDVEVMFIPSFIIFSIFIGIGLITVFNFIKNTMKDFKIEINFRKIKINTLNLFIVFIIVASFLLVPVTSYFTNYSQIEEINNDNFAYFAYTSLNGVPSNSTIITYWKSYAAFKYFQIVNKVNPNVTIIHVEEKDLLDTTNQRINNGNVFIYHEISSIYLDYRLISFIDIDGVGTLYKVEKFEI